MSDTLNRREFFERVAGIVVFCAIEEDLEAQESGGGGRRRGEIPREVDAWLHIGEDGSITAYTGKVEVGQNARTSLTQAVAEELRVPIASIQLVMGDTDRCPFDAGTFGSQTTPQMWPRLAQAAASAREALLDLAAEQMKADRNALKAADGKITNPASGVSSSYGEIAKGRKLLKTIDSAKRTPVSDWKIAGTPVPKVNAEAFVTGRHKYTSDQKLPGMFYGTVLRPAAFGATLESLDASAAEAIAGVKVVRDGEFIGVAAPDPGAANRGIEALRAEWKTTPQPGRDELFEHLKKTASAGNSRHETGSVADGLASADHKLEQTYTVAYIAHTPLEPRAAVAQWSGDKLTVWTGTQRPFGVRGELAQALQIPESNVRVIVPDTGSGYGGKHTGEAAVEAARLARACGHPVKLVWTREEELTWAYFRPGGVIEVRGGARRDGTITAWEFHNYNSGPSGIRTLYDIANQKIEFHPSKSPLRQGSYRGLAATANHFARETAVDELAHAVKMDPLEFRHRNLKDPRQLAVLDAAAKAFGWGKTKNPSGIACGFEKNGYVATCVEAEGKRVVRAVTAFECGAIVNPNHLRHQVEGAVVMALGGALSEDIRFENGRILNARLSAYHVPRFSVVPKIETVLVNRPDLPSSGAGETPIVCVAPAIGNAMFAGDGVRRRSMPLA